MSGLLGYGACYEATHEADLLILIGTDFPYDSFLPQRGTVQIDVDPARLGRRTLLELGVHGDAASTLDALLPRIAEKTDRSFLDRMLRKHAEALEKVVGAYTRKVSDLRPIHPEHVAAVLDEEMAEDAIATVDTGMCNVWAARYLSPTAGAGSSAPTGTGRWPTPCRTRSVRSSRSRTARSCRCPATAG